MTPQAQTREAAVAALNDARNGEGRADSWLDRSLYDRCITRGLPGSMMPAIYGNAYEIVQTPDSVAIRYEMIHETRIIPLDGRPQSSDKQLREYLGDARGHWDGNTLVVETTNFTDRTHFGYNNRYNSEKFTLTERFTPIGPEHGAVGGDVQRSRGLDAAVHVRDAADARRQRSQSSSTRATRATSDSSTFSGGARRGTRAEVEAGL